MSHGTFDGDKADDHIDAEIIDVIEDVMVSPEGIDAVKPKPQGEGAPLISSGRNRPERSEGI